MPRAAGQCIQEGPATEEPCRMHRPRAILLFAVIIALAWRVFPAAAQAPEEAGQVWFNMGAPAGIRRLRPETWGLLAVNVVNPGDVVRVKLLAVDERGRLKLSRRAAMTQP